MVSVTGEELEAVIRAAIQITHMKVEENSGCCGRSTLVVIVSNSLIMT
jgi:hypothetical protein